MGRRLVPLKGNKENDVVFTPLPLARTIVQHFRSQIRGSVLEPFAGEGVFVDILRQEGFNPEWCEINRGRDFFKFSKHVNWIVTNPPFSISRTCLQHCYKVSDNIIALMQVGHIMGFKCRNRDRCEAGFGIKELIYVATPIVWSSSGIQMCVAHLQKGWTSGILEKYEFSKACAAIAGGG